MGAEDEGTPAKSSKTAASTKEVPAAPAPAAAAAAAATPPYPDWSSSMQAYYGGGGAPAPFFASTVATPASHPYLWGGQHPFSPYGTPVPYQAVYPPGGVYAHPSMAMTPSVVHTNADVEGKNADKNDKGSSKKSKGRNGSKAVSGSGNDDFSQSGESGGDTSDGSDENANQQNLVPGKPVASKPATNLNIGMDLWNGSPAAAGTANIRANHNQDDRELKRQKRKQSNRESARRSRLRKQAECEELQSRVDTLTNDNHSLKEELQRLSEKCEKLKSENDSVKEQLTTLCGPDAVANLD